MSQIVSDACNRHGSNRKISIPLLALLSGNWKIFGYNLDTPSLWQLASSLVFEDLVQADCCKLLVHTFTLLLMPPQSCMYKWPTAGNFLFKKPSYCVLSMLHSYNYKSSTVSHPCITPFFVDINQVCQGQVPQSQHLCLQNLIALGLCFLCCYPCIRFCFLQGREF